MKSNWSSDNIKETLLLLLKGGMIDTNTHIHPFTHCMCVYISGHIHATVHVCTCVDPTITCRESVPSSHHVGSEGWPQVIKFGGNESPLAHLLFCFFSWDTVLLAVNSQSSCFFYSLSPRIMGTLLHTREYVPFSSSVYVSDTNCKWMGEKTCKKSVLN